ncbi:PD-(D/E)XK nuclease-like domain-containing protein [Paraburkholderia sp.]|uniref:PD-(D/E)XK nuclease-like domain-containing protein n=1 Tax=Paraburkholderia sp. TaxID=1926495 RepID=UPI002D366BC8|nr:PD-(D/E)XK nuclease-like domain-containing protein [Paraburkholderia sp.]HZZ05639.1 PD-(D/E)XK nuclease-like domain-containing protein [Paraburkholderia sp.]
MQHTLRPGVYDLTNDAYHGGPGTSKSGLDILHKSAEKFAFAKSPDAPERVSTPSQAFGSAYHAIVLEPDVFTRTYCLGLRMCDVPEAINDADVLVSKIQALNAGRLPKLPSSGTKDELIDRILAGRAEQNDDVSEVSRAALCTMKGAELKTEIERLNFTRTGLLSVSGSRHELAALLRANGVPVTLWSDVQAEWLTNNTGRIVLSESDWNTLHAMREVLMRHPAAGKLLRRRGRAEMSFYWVDPETGELLRVRPDKYTDCGLCLDLKTARDASFDGFVSSIQSYRYDVQHPFYLDGIAAAIEQGKLDIAKPRAFFFIAQEAEPPYSVGVYSLDPEDVELGRLEYRADLRKLAQCRATGHFPGYGDDIQQISLTSWHRQKTALAVSAESVQ